MLFRSTAFNTVWTYDIYQALAGGRKTDAELLKMGKIATVAGIVMAMGCAFIAAKYNNVMAILQLIFGFVNAPLFATFLLGMFSRRSNHQGSFWGLVIGTSTAVIFHGLCFATGNAPGVKGGWIKPLIEYPKDLSQTFWIATVAFSATFIIHAFLSLVTKRNKTDEELRGLVYSLTEKQVEDKDPWIIRPAILGTIVLVASIFLNWYFW